MATDKIMVDDEEIAGVELSKEEKKRLKRQEKKLKKFGLKDESKLAVVLREIFHYLSYFAYLAYLVHIHLYTLSVLLLNHLQNCLYTHLNYSSKILH